MNCELKHVGTRLVCPTCGFSMRYSEGNILRNCPGVSPKEQPQQIRGLGDVIDAVTTATGIKAVVHAVAGEDCGCQKRREKLNEMFPMG